MLVAENILFGGRQCILRSEEMIALMPKHLTMNHKAGSTHEERALMPIGQRRSRTLDCGQLVRNVVLNVPTRGN